MISKSPFQALSVLWSFGPGSKKKLEACPFSSGHRELRMGWNSLSSFQMLLQPSVVFTCLFPAHSFWALFGKLELVREGWAKMKWCVLAPSVASDSRSWSLTVCSHTQVSDGNNSTLIFSTKLSSLRSLQRKLQNRHRKTAPVVHLSQSFMFWYSVLLLCLNKIGSPVFCSSFLLLVFWDSW